MDYSVDYYEILQVHRQATPEVIKAAYEKLSSLYDSDNDYPDNEGYLKKLDEAYEVLGNPEQRKLYDSYYQPAANQESAATATYAMATPAEVMVRPWVRYFARLFDIYIGALTVFFLTGFFLALINYSLYESFDHFISSIPEILLGLIIMGIWLFIEAALISIWGSTPGKWLLNTRVLNSEGGRLSYENALYRGYMMFFRGMGVGIPLVSLIAMLIAYRKLAKNGQTSWDKDYGAVVVHEKLSALKVVAFIAIVFLSLLFIGYAQSL